ncbi:ATP phosphoribosyltransferase regulatory subunit, partial [Chloroflexota bacterium]
GRGFEYYTGVMFRLLAGGEHIGGGGRYDDLIPLMGGREIPASGFALYFDRLMKQVKMEKPASPVAQKVLIKAEDGKDILKEAFKLGDALHKSGFTAEVYLGGPEPANLKWLINVRDKAPLFTLTDHASQKTSEVKTADEVLKLLKA